MTRLSCFWETILFVTGWTRSYASFARHPSDLALVGVYLFNAEIFRAVSAIQPSARGELEITDAIQWLVDNGYAVEPHLIRGWWKDTGRPEDVLDANRLMLEALERDVRGEVDGHSHVVGRVQIGTGSRVVRSTLRGSGREPHRKRVSDRRFSDRSQGADRASGE